MMDTMLQDLRYALRTLARSPGLSLAAVLTLGLGIGANTAMFGVVDRLFFRPPAHVVDPDRVVRIYVTTTMPPFGTNTMPISATSKPCRTTSASTSCRAAPSAMRTPSSWVR